MQSFESGLLYVESFEVVCYESKGNVDVDLNRLGKVNLCCCTVLPLVRRMELWYGILNQQITDRRGNFVYGVIQ